MWLLQKVYADECHEPVAGSVRRSLRRGGCHAHQPVCCMCVCRDSCQAYNHHEAQQIYPNQKMSAIDTEARMINGVIHA